MAVQRELMYSLTFDKARSGWMDAAKRICLNPSVCKTDNLMLCPIILHPFSQTGTVLSGVVQISCKIILHSNCTGLRFELQPVDTEGFVVHKFIAGKLVTDYLKPEVVSC